MSCTTCENSGQGNEGRLDRKMNGRLKSRVLTLESQKTHINDCVQPSINYLSINLLIYYYISIHSMISVYSYSKLNDIYDIAYEFDISLH